MRTHVHKNSKHTVNSVVCIGGHGVVTSCRLYTQSTYVPFCFNPYLKKVIFFFHSTNVTIDWLLNCLSILLLAQVPLSSARVALKCPCCHRTSNPSDCRVTEVSLGRPKWPESAHVITSIVGWWSWVASGQVRCCAVSSCLPRYTLFNPTGNCQLQSPLVAAVSSSECPRIK